MQPFLTCAQWRSKIQLGLIDASSFFIIITFLLFIITQSNKLYKKTALFGLQNSS